MVSLNSIAEGEIYTTGLIDIGLDRVIENRQVNKFIIDFVITL